MPTQNVLLVGSHGNHKTGINYVLMEIAAALKDYHLSYASISGGRTQKHYLASKIPTYDAVGDPRRLLEVIANVRPDVVISFDDVWHLEAIEYARSKYPFYWVHYFLTEEAQLHPGKTVQQPDRTYKVDMRPTLDRCDALIPSTTHSEAVAKAWQLENIQPLLHPPVPVNTFSYSRKLRDNFRELHGYDSKDFVFVVVAKNFIRKNIPFVMECMFYLQREADKLPPGIIPKLFLHVPRLPMIASAGYDLAYLKSIYEILPKSIHISTEEEGKVFDDRDEEYLQAIYSGGDTLISLPYAEGIGYPVIEAMLCNMPVVVGHGGYPRRYAAELPEALKRNVLVKQSGHYIAPGMNQIWYQYSLQDALTAMASCIKTYHRKKRAEGNRDLVIDYFKPMLFAENWKTVVSNALKVVASGVKA